MNIQDYSQTAITTLLSNQAYGEISPKLMDQVLGLVGESGEIAEKFKKLIRDKNGEISEADTTEIIKELGDVLWYINTISVTLGRSLEEVAEVNLEKVLSRQSRNVLNGSGDNR
jgi:NTP pyrophosphatase (non-canonical NTP hydrolase)